MIEKDIIGLLKKGDENAFELFFRSNYKKLQAYAFFILKNEEQAYEVVQQVFFTIWSSREKLGIQTSLKSYLYKSVYHECLKEIKKRSMHEAYRVHAQRSKEDSAPGSASQKVDAAELNAGLQRALSDLPEQCRNIFELSRFEGLKYQEIADHTGLSIKTIESQMGKALKRLRISLAEFLPLIIYTLWLL